MGIKWVQYVKVMRRNTKDMRIICGNCGKEFPFDYDTATVGTDEWDCDCVVLKCPHCGEEKRL